MDYLMTFMPYITSIVCAVVSGIVTSSVCKKQTRSEIEKLVRQHELNLESQKIQYEHEIDKLNIEHKHQLELKAKEFENKINSDMLNTIIGEAMKNQEIQKMISQGVNKGKR